MKLIRILKSKLFKRKDAQSIGLEREVKAVQLETLLQLQKALNESTKPSEEFKAKFFEVMNKEINAHRSEINALDSKLSKTERREVRDWHIILKDFVLKGL